MAEEMDRRQAELNEAQEMIRRLEEQLRQLQAAKEELEGRQKVRLNDSSIQSVSRLIVHNYRFFKNEFA